MIFVYSFYILWYYIEVCKNWNKRDKLFKKGKQGFVTLTGSGQPGNEIICEFLVVQ